MDEGRSVVEHPIVKVCSAWTVVGVTTVAHAANPTPNTSLWLETLNLLGITSWTEAGAFLATFYTFLLISEWWWRRFWRPMLERAGWLKPKKRHVLTASEFAKLDQG